MASETKGFLSGQMKFNVGEDAAKGEQQPLLPLRLVVVADLVPRDPYNAGASPPAGAIRIDTQSFEALFARLRPRIAIEVPSVLADGRNARIDLAPTSVKSFRPDGLCSEVPLLRALLDGRLALDRLRDGSITVEQARQELHRLWSGSPFAEEVLGLLPTGARAAGASTPAAAPAVAPADSSGVDSLLAMVDLGGTIAAAQQAAPAADGEPSRAAPGSRISELISAVVQSARPKAGKPVQPAQAIAAVERAIGAQIGAILQHPEVRRLEEAWRSLGFLVERSKSHASTRLAVVVAHPDEAASALARALKDTAATEPPVTAAIVDIEVDGSAASFARLEAIASLAEAYTMPTIVNGTPGLLRAEDLAAVERMDNKATLFQAPHQAPWRSAAARHDMRWIAIAMNRALARAPYDKSTSRMREAVIVEEPRDRSAFVWLSPAHLVGSLILGSFRDTGWPCRVVGARNGGTVENLQVHELKSGYEGDEGVAIPTEVFISTDTQREMARYGVLMLASAPNSDAIYLLTAPTAYVPPEKRTYDSATTEPEDRLERVSLVDQLFVGRLVQFLRALCSKLPASSDPAEVQPVVEGAAWTLFENAAPASVELSVKARAGSDGTVVAISVRPRRFLGVTIDEIGFEIPLG
ncbi:MAG TPA: type VI secretion system contractile sheath large subunit [Candidatus Nanopelagicales bacterium]|nr:type VI secretion system contractile sheath large subunit [Candidatus Nanopelagicales bacterium]